MNIVHEVRDASSSGSYPAWLGFTVVSFAAAVAMVALGLLYLPLPVWERGYMAMATVFLLHAAVSLTKTLRDRHDDREGEGRR